MADVQIAVIDQQNTQIALAAPSETEVTVAVPGVQGPVGATGDVTIAQDGTAALPGIRFENDTNTGIYSPGADQVAISTNGTGRLFVDANGNVNVGTTFAGLFNGGGMEIQRSTTATLRLTGSYGVGCEFYNTGTLASIQTRSTIPFTIQTNELERLRITSDGKLGLGTSSPNKLLHVAGTEGVVGAYQFELEGRFGGYGAGLQFSSRTTDGGTLLGMAKITADGEDSWDTTAASQDAGLRFYTTLNGTLAEKLRINASGNVGIGTTGPNYSLDVVSTGSISAAFTSTGSENYIALKDSGTTLGHVRIGSISNELTFRAGNSERARIDSSGRLLVGTSTARSNISRGLTTGITPQVQIETAFDSYNSGLSIINNSNSEYGAQIRLGISKSTAIGSNVIPTSGAQIGTFSFNANDGTNFVEAARIEANIDGTPGANDMPGRLVFSTTADGASSPTERMRISSSGNVYIGTTVGNAPFTVAGTNIEVINTNGAYVNNSQTTSVSTSATTIVADAGFQGRLWVINGATGGDRFCDLVMASTAAAPVVVQSFTAIGSPAARTYTRSGSALQLAMASGTYDVRCIGMGA